MGLHIILRLVQIHVTTGLEGITLIMAEFVETFVVFDWGMLMLLCLN